ncbi:MAG: hypothetical protein IPI79_09800 [Moraxellaceae bacterium]|nr:hypothetical protein [Moraxellaceae bacterium]
MTIKLVGVLAVVMLSGCQVVTPSPVGNGALFTSVKNLSYHRFIGSIKQAKLAKYFRLLASSGDASIVAAKKQVILVK